MTLKFDASTFRKFVILLYKGLLLRKRHYILTAFELILAVFIASVPAIIQSEANIPSFERNSYWINDTVYSAFDPFIKKQYENNVLFAYAPSNNNTHMLMEEALNLWKDNMRQYNIESKALEDGNKLENYYMVMKRNNGSNWKVIGTVFNNIYSKGEGLPSSLDYTIREDSRFETNLKYRFPNSYKYSAYTSSLFLSWQAAVEKAFIKKKMIEENAIFDYELWMQEFPYPGHLNRSYGFGLSSLIPVGMTYGFLIFTLNLIARVIQEKSSGSKELLKMMGMTDFIYWFSTFLNYFLVGVIIILQIVIIYKSPLKNSTVLLPHSNILLLFILFLLFVASLILFSLALTTFFNKAIFGIIVMLIIYNVSYALLQVYVFPLDPNNYSYYSLSFSIKFCICLLPPGAILTICQMMNEMSGEGLLWSNLYNSDIVPDFSLSWLMISLLFSCFLYVVIIWYIDAVWPWQYGAPKPLYFPFTKSYWCGYEEKKVQEILLGSEDKIKNQDFFEEDPIGMSPGVIIHDLSKIFKTGFQTKVAVNKISLNIYNGQITALLGHNGAGKTTTINILTGLYSPSAGTASINGWDIFSQTSRARQSLGVCPQHDMLYDTLTVEEHLKIYAVLKGVGWSQLDHETNNVLSLLNLTPKKTELAKNLSGGMKRKLSLGIAFIGGSKVLFLDEPTSGMDVEARRNVWDTLLEIRHNRTIILTTHYMEEADILGDRIAIMADGQLQCCGSPLFLKKKFGTGYHLHLVKEKNFDMSAMSNILEKFVPSFSLENDYEREVTFNMMSNAHSNFGALFEEIESKKDILGVNSCGVTVTTMEDVFLNVSNLADLEVKAQDFSFENDDEIEMKDIYIESNEFGRSQKFINQLYGLFLKRFHYAKRHFYILIPQLILPFAIMCLCLFILNISSYSSSMNESPLKLDIKKIYGKTDGFYHSDNDPSSLLIAAEIKNVLEEKSINVKSVNDSEKFVLNYGNKSMTDYFKRLMVGGSVKTKNGKQNITAWFNGYPHHAEPISLLLIDSAILRRVTKSGYIALENNPLPHISTYFSKRSSYLKEKITAMVFVPLALSFLSSSFVLVPIHERASKAKLLQMMTGISSATYWLSMFVWDFIVINTVVSLFLIIPFAIFSHYAFFSPHSEAIGTAILIMIFYGWSSIPFSYLFSLIFKRPNTGFAVINAFNIIIGVAVCLILSSINMSTYPADTEDSAMTTVQKLIWIFKIFPSFALSLGFSNLFQITYANAYCDTIDPIDLIYNCGQPLDANPIIKCCKDICGSKCVNQTFPITMDENACGRAILFLFLDGILYFSLLLLLDSSFMRNFFYHCWQRIPRFRKIADIHFVNCNYVEDSEVLQEEERVKNNYEQVSHNDALVVLNLSKKFKNIKAVDSLTFGIHKKECFGLLGVNGAGKTTTFRMLAGDCYPTEGNAFIGSCSVLKNLKKFQSYIGYCPQYDALIDRLSAREMITLFARLRGLNGLTMTKYVNSLIKMADLTQYADKPSMVYSGGNKRKLSLALALIGAPPLLLLDEPTSGVDPVSRRKIWKILSLARIYSGAAVILTTHSMEESEALCSRLAIMVNGRFRCLGSIQQLKTKFGQGYTLIIKMKKEKQSISQSISSAKAFIDTNLPGANLKEDHQGMLQYHVVDPSVTLSYLFRFMDDMKGSYDIEDYVISDTSLEQIFLLFAQSQQVVAA